MGGAIAIHLSGGIILLGWLLFGGMDLPLRGSIFLWSIALLLVVIRMVEWILHIRKGKK